MDFVNPAPLACDVSEEWTSIARHYRERAGVADRIELRLAPANQMLRARPGEAASISRSWTPTRLATLNDTIAADPRLDSVMLPVRDGATLSRRRD